MLRAPFGTTLNYGKINCFMLIIPLKLGETSTEHTPNTKQVVLPKSSIALYINDCDEPGK
jgi:hypothetical protein